MLRRGLQPSSIIGKIAQYTVAEMSRYFCKIAPDEVEKRKATCRSCEYLEKSMTVPPQVGFCTGCGCPQWRRSELSVKATMPMAECPRGKWKAYQLTMPPKDKGVV